MRRARKVLDRIDGIGDHVGDMDDVAAPRHARRHRFGVDVHRIERAHDVDRLGSDALDRCQLDRRTLDARNDRHFRLAELAGAAREQVEHGLHVGWRAAHHAEDLAHRRLLLERFLRPVSRATQFDFAELARRDVAERSDDFRDPPARVTHSHAAIEDPSIAAVPVVNSVFVLEARCAPLEMRDDGGSISGVVVGVDACIPGVGRQRVPAKCEELFRLHGEKQPAGGEVPLVDALEGRGRGECIAFLDLVQAALHFGEACTQRGDLASVKRFVAGVVRGHRLCSLNGMPEPPQARPFA